MFSHLEKHLILALAVAVWVSILLFLALGRLGNKIPEPPSLPTYAFRSYRAVKEGPIARVLSPAVLNTLKPATQQANPFYSIQLFPPTPPPPKTRIIEVLYQGFFTTSHGEKYAYLQADNKLQISRIGAQAIGNLVVADANHKGLTLKDETGKETFLPFTNTVYRIEVPIQ